MMKSDSIKRDEALKIIYQNNKEKVCSFIISNNGSNEEAKDIFQESVIAFYENVLHNKFKGDSTISTYLYSIARFKWLNEIKKNKIRMSHDNQYIPDEEFNKNPLAMLIDDENKTQIIKLLDELGSSCKKILIESIYFNYSMKEIAYKFNFSSEQIVRNKKYKCMKKLKELIAKKPALIQILKSYDY